MSAGMLLDRLDALREVPARRNFTRSWKARCPGPLHERGDRVPSLAVDETADGRLLLVCRTGCETASILAAIGLTFRDIAPERVPGDGAAPSRNTISARDAFEIADHELLVFLLIHDDLEHGRTTFDQVRPRLAECARRLGLLRDVIAPARVYGGAR